MFFAFSILQALTSKWLKVDGNNTVNEPFFHEFTDKAAEVRYVSADEVNKVDLARCLKKSLEIQWDYNNIVKPERLK